MIVAPKRLKLTPPAPALERIEQATYFGWIHYQKSGTTRIGDYAFAVPNGSYLAGSIAQRAIQGRALRSQGVRAGVPDVFVLLPRRGYHGLCIEFKRIDGPKPRPEQVDWHVRLIDAGYCVHVAYGFEQARRATLHYFNCKEAE